MEHKAALSSARAQLEKRGAGGGEMFALHVATQDRPQARQAVGPNPKGRKRSSEKHLGSCGVQELPAPTVNRSRS